MPIPAPGPTPPGPSATPSASDPPHHHRAVAESFGDDPERYDRARPRYPDALVARIATTAPGPTVLDVGTGTGIVARQLAAHGCTVLGVEPDERMAAFARRTGIDVEVAAFERWDPAGRTVDAVVAGQTWHWVDPDAGARAAARVLRLGGSLTVFWNDAQPSGRILDDVAAVYERVLPGSLAARFAAGRAGSVEGDRYAALGDTAAEGMRRAGGFGEPERLRWVWPHTYTRAEWLDLLPTQGGHSQTPPDALAELLDGVGAVIDAAGGSITVDYTTLAVSAVRR